MRTKTSLRVGDKFRLTESAREGYADLMEGQGLDPAGVFTVSHVARNEREHPGYDRGVAPDPLYDAEELTFSVYAYEIEVVHG